MAGKPTSTYSPMPLFEPATLGFLMSALLVPPRLLALCVEALVCTAVAALAVDMKIRIHINFWVVSL